MTCMLLIGLLARITSMTAVLGEWLGIPLTWTQTRLTPAMPWIFIAFRRAVIPTVIAFIGPMLFLGVAQGRDIVYGLTEPRLSSWRSDPWPFHVPGVSAYFVTACGYALSVWYSARLLCTVEPQGLPHPLTPSEYKGPAEWYPRLLGVTTLSLLYAALLAMCSDHLPLAVVGACGPTLLAHYLFMAADRSLRRTRVVLVFGIIASTALAYCLFNVKWKLQVLLFALAWVPAAFWAMVVKRRRWFTVGGTATKEQLFSAVLVRLLSWFLLSVGVVLLAFAWPEAPFLRACGSAAVAFLFLAALSLFLATCHLVVRYCADGVPGLSAVILLAFATLVAMFGDEGLGHETLAPPKAAPGPGAPNTPAVGPACDPDSSNLDVCDPTVLAKSRRVYVNTYGGGIRAAAFTAQVLAEADDLTCGRFGSSLVAVSGVSGGSVGLAVYLVARQEAVAHGIWGSCKPSDSDLERSRPLTSIVKDTLAQDHLPRSSPGCWHSMLLTFLVPRFEARHCSTACRARSSARTTFT